jgi:hypothetical protein
MEKEQKKPGKEAANMRATTVRLPKDLILAAKLYALRHETTLTDLIIEGLKAQIGPFEVEDRRGTRVYTPRPIKRKGG